MSLLLLQTGSPAINYLSCPPPSTPGQNYFPEFCTLPRTFQEELASVEGYYYDPNTDTYNFLGLMNQIFWPSWSYVYWSIDPKTGLEIQRTSITGGATDFAWTGSRRSGDFKKVYAQRIANPTNALVEIDPALGVPNSFQLANPVITNNDVNGLSLSLAVVNRQDTIVGVVDNFDFVTVDYSTATEIRRIRLPENNVVDTAYEDNERCWVLMTDVSGGLIVVKINYILGRIELMSRLQDSLTGPDISASIAFDTRRKNISVFRRKADGTDGSAQSIVEIYKPISLSTILTDPVPVTAIEPNKEAIFVAHVLGDKGEAGSGVQVKATTITGKIKKGTSSAKGDGSVVLPYEAPDKNLTDTISLEINC